MGKGGDEFIERMLESGRLSSGEETKYASGLALGTYKGRKTIRHNGSSFGFCSEMIRFPEETLTVMVLCNLSTMEPWTLAEQIADLYLSSDLQ